MYGCQSGIHYEPDSARPFAGGDGLCLNALHDRAFDRGLMTVTADFKVQMSGALKPTNKADEEPFSWLWRFDGKAPALPKGFPPDAVLLASHRERWSG